MLSFMKTKCPKITGPAAYVLLLLFSVSVMNVLSFENSTSHHNKFCETAKTIISAIFHEKGTTVKNMFLMSLLMLQYEFQLHLWSGDGKLSKLAQFLKHGMLLLWGSRLSQHPSPAQASCSYSSCRHLLQVWKLCCPPLSLSVCAFVFSLSWSSFQSHTLPSSLCLLHFLDKAM